MSLGFHAARITATRRAGSAYRFLRRTTPRVACHTGVYTIFFAFALIILTVYKKPLPVDVGMVAATCVLYVACMAVSLPLVVLRCVLGSEVVLGSIAAQSRQTDIRPSRYVPLRKEAIRERSHLPLCVVRLAHPERPRHERPAARHRCPLQNLRPPLPAHHGVFVFSFSAVHGTLRSPLLAPSVAFVNLSDTLPDRYTAAGQCGIIGPLWSSSRWA